MAATSSMHQSDMLSTNPGTELPWPCAQPNLTVLGRHDRSQVGIWPGHCWVRPQFTKHPVRQSRTPVGNAVLGLCIQGHL